MVGAGRAVRGAADADDLPGHARVEHRPRRGPHTHPVADQELRPGGRLTPPCFSACALAPGWAFLVLTVATLPCPSPRCPALRQGPWVACPAGASVVAGGARARMTAGRCSRPQLRPSGWNITEMDTVVVALLLADVPPPCLDVSSRRHLPLFRPAGSVLHPLGELFISRGRCRPVAYGAEAPAPAGRPARSPASFQREGRTRWIGPPFDRPCWRCWSTTAVNPSDASTRT